MLLYFVRYDRENSNGTGTVKQDIIQKADFSVSLLISMGLSEFWIEIGEIFCSSGILYGYWIYVIR